MRKEARQDRKHIQFFCLFTFKWHLIFFLFCCLAANFLRKQISEQGCRVCVPDLVLWVHSGLLQTLEPLVFYGLIVCYSLIVHLPRLNHKLLQILALLFSCSLSQILSLMVYYDLTTNCFWLWLLFLSLFFFFYKAVWLLTHSLLYICSISAHYCIRLQLIPQPWSWINTQQPLVLVAVFVIWRTGVAILSC